MKSKARVERFEKNKKNEKSKNEKRRFPWRAETGAFHCGREINEEGEEKRKIRLPSPLGGGGERKRRPVKGDGINLYEKHYNAGM